MADADSAQSSSRLTVFAVVFSNYYPAEVNSLWKTQESAQRHADSLDGDMWRVEEWDVQDG